MCLAEVDGGVNEVRGERLESETISDARFCFATVRSVLIRRIVWI